MVMSVVEGQSAKFIASEHPDLAGARILITGLESGHGVDIARAFAEHGCRLVLQTAALDKGLEVLLETLVRDAAGIHISDTPIDSEDAALRFAQSAAGVFGGLDAVVNLARLDDAGLCPEAGIADIEARLSRTLSGPLLITRVIANRMQLTWREGLILNIVTQRRPQTPAAAQLGRIARTALAALTKREAQRWGDRAVRVNAIAPAADDGCAAGEIEPGLGCEPEIAALALRLASAKGKALSGLVFDAGLV